MKNNIVCCKNKENCSGKKPGKIVDVDPTYTQLLVEHLTEQETVSDKIILKSGNDKSKQAYIVKIGPEVPKEKGFKVGDRLLLQGSYVPVPKFDNRERELGIIELINVKAILREGE